MVVEQGTLLRIVEDKDATAKERENDLCFAGMLAAHAPGLFRLLHEIGNRNAQGEFYLTDVIAVANMRGARCQVVEGAEAEMLGVNSRAQLAEAESEKEGQMSEKQAELLLHSMKDEEQRVQLDERKVRRRVYNDW